MTVIFFSKRSRKSKYLTVFKTEAVTVLCVSLDDMMLLATTLAVLGDSGVKHSTFAPSWSPGSEA